MLRKPQFLNLIRQGDFKELFVAELGWNRYRGSSQLPPIIVDEKEYNITAIAERSGFQVLFSEVNEIPTQSVAKKIDTKLRRQALDYICIYRKRGSAHDLWVVPVRTNEKRDLVLVEYDNANAEVLYQKIDGITFDLDEQTNIVDLRSKVQTAFAINSEKITKDFYAGFKKQHKAFAEFISGIDDHVDTKNNRNKQWYASVMLNRLMFCYFIQKKGFLNLDVDYLRNKLNFVRANEGEDIFYNFYRSFLCNLFHDGLNMPKHSHDFEVIFGKIPYLNGGMFDEHPIEAQYADIDIPDEAFIGLFDFFDKWNWHLDTRLTASGKDINPDVLGYIFEQYINDRAQMGAYYTKEDITEYIGRNCILPYLFDQVRASTKDSAKEFEPNGYVWSTLRESGDRYIFDAVKKGYKDFDIIPEPIARGIITKNMHKEYSETPVGELPDSHIPLAELRSEWNTRTPEHWGLPNEIWRETIDRLQRCGDILGKINRGEINSINDFITYNLDIRTFASDLILNGDSRFVGWFYHALQKVTILDPTCGSGAFLFAAINILEPLYEICIDRMQEFNRENPAKFKEELAEITDKYRSNIQYFIFKSIILRNLYGVDIMVEATEIAKLRLFLKMVAVVDVERRSENLGLDPLPDIDFNIRCGNTLVGYANKSQLDHDLSHAEDIMQELANQEFKQQIDEEMQKVAAAYRIFVFQQLCQEEDMVAFKQAKQDLRTLLKSLNDKLNHRLFSASSPNISYDEWLKSHQPFNWLAEFYQIIEGNRGFDVIIGNPPYVEFPSKDVNYKFDNLKSANCGNLYGCCTERGYQIGKLDGRFSFIIPVAITCSQRMSPVIEIMKDNSNFLQFANFDDRPGKLFEMIEHLRACIFISAREKHNCAPQIFASKYNRWYTSNRSILFSNLQFVDVTKFVTSYIIPKFSAQIECDINSCLQNVKTLTASFYGVAANNSVYYRAAGGGYFLLVKPTKSITYINGQLEDVKAEKAISIKDEYINVNIAALLSSSLFYWNYIGYTDCRNLTKSFIDNFPCPASLASDSELTNAGQLLSNDYEKNRYKKDTFYKTTGRNVIYYEYYPKLSKSIIDIIDSCLGAHYNFTDEELDFIINYDIKYRMGDELNNSNE